MYVPAVSGQPDIAIVSLRDPLFKKSILQVGWQSVPSEVDVLLASISQMLRLTRACSGRVAVAVTVHFSAELSQCCGCSGLREHLSQIGG